MHHQAQHWNMNTQYSLTNTLCTNLQARKVRKQSPAKLAREVSDSSEQVQQLLITGSVGLRGLDIPQPSTITTQYSHLLYH